MEWRRASVATTTNIGQQQQNLENISKRKLSFSGMRTQNDDYNSNTGTSSPLLPMEWRFSGGGKDGSGSISPSIKNMLYLNDQVQQDTSAKNLLLVTSGIDKVPEEWVSFSRRRSLSEEVINELNARNGNNNGGRGGGGDTSSSSSSSNDNRLSFNSCIDKNLREDEKSNRK